MHQMHTLVAEVGKQCKKLSQNKVPVQYKHGKRMQNILHTKLRLGCSRGCSDLNYDKHFIGLVPSSICNCAINEAETAEHFLLECGNNLHLVSWNYRLIIRLITLYQNGVSSFPLNTACIGRGLTLVPTPEFQTFFSYF